MIIVKQGRKRLEEDGSRNCGLQMTGDDGKKPERSTGLYRLQAREVYRRSRAWTEVDVVHILFLTGWTRQPCTLS